MYIPRDQNYTWNEEEPQLNRWLSYYTKSSAKASAMSVLSTLMYPVQLRGNIQWLSLNKCWINMRVRRNHHNPICKWEKQTNRVPHWHLDMYSLPGFSLVSTSSGTPSGFSSTQVLQYVQWFWPLETVAHCSQKCPAAPQHPTWVVLHFPIKRFSLEPSRVVSAKSRGRFPSSTTSVTLQGLLCPTVNQSHVLWTQSCLSPEYSSY